MILNISCILNLTSFLIYDFYDIFIYKCVINSNYIIYKTAGQSRSSKAKPPIFNLNPLKKPSK
jgi:hypothetical protein